MAALIMAGIPTGIREAFMRMLRRIGGLTIALAFVGSGIGLAAVPAVAAATSGGPAGSAGSAGSGMAPAAAVSPAPVVTDARPDVRTKAGLGAPEMSVQMLQANVRRQAKALALLQLMADSSRSRTPGLKCTSLACRAGLPAARDLAGTQQPQVRNYFCGPATVSEMLAQLGVKVGQYTAARELGTNLSGTDWSDASGYPVPRVLNENQTRNSYVAVSLPWTPGTQQVSTSETDLVVDINDNGGVPLAGNAYEVPGGPHLVGNPVDQMIMHWFDIRGYQNYGAITDYEDSVHDATSIGWGASVPAYSSMPSAVIVDILGARGYDW
jgi:hypothetical protein